MTSIDGYLPGTGTVRVHLSEGRIGAVDVIDHDASWREDWLDHGLVLPGLVDLQVNGYAGIDLNDSALSEDAMRELIRSLWATGVTRFCPTLVTGPLDRLTDALRLFDRVRESGTPEAACLLGAHLEGPWISAVDGARGAHRAEHVIACTPADVRTVLDAGRVSIVTLAPESPGALDAIGLVTAHGAIASIGHSAAAPSDIAAAAAAGASMSTHLGNGVPQLLPRHPNLVWSQLADDRLVAAFIADLHHLDVETLSAMIRAKGEERVVLVSDATSIAGLPAGRYRTLIGGDVDLDASGRLNIHGTDYLAGAALPLLAGLAHVLGRRLMSPGQSVRAATTRPLHLMNRRPGAEPAPLAVGAPGDVVLARWDESSGPAVESTWVDGRLRWAR